MKKFLKFLLVAFIWSVIFGVCFAGAILAGSTETIGIQIFVAIFVGWYGIKFCVYLYKRWQAKKRVEKLINIESEQSDKTKLSFFQFLFSKDIDKHIKRVIARVHRNASVSEQQQDANFIMHLKMDNKHADWLCNDSTNKPKINDPIFNEYKHIDWLVFNQLVVLDVDSYLIKDANAAANSEWLQILHGLASSEKEKSLDGLLVSIHVNDLKELSTRNKIADTLRKKYEEIKEHCGVEVPLNITLLGLEELSGVDDWLARLTEDWKAQTLGIVNQNSNTVDTLVDSCFSQMQDVFKQGSLTYLVNQGFEETVANLPHKTNKVQLTVGSFCNRLFSSNSFQGKPACAGLFVVMSQGNKASFADQLLEQSVLCWLPATSTKKSTASDIESNKRLATYFSAATLLVIILALLHGNDKEGIDDIYQQYEMQLSNSEEQDKIIANFESRYQLINRLNDVNISHWLPLAEGDFKVPALKATLANDIQDTLILPIDNFFEDQIKQIDKSDNEVKVDYLTILMRRINVLSSASNGASLFDLALLPQPFDSLYIENFSPDVIDGLNDLYLKSLVMQRAVDSANYRKAWQQQIIKYQGAISSLLLSSDGTMDWLIDWVNNNQNVEHVKLNDYWQGSKSIASSASVKASYTLAGKEIIDDFSEQILSALGDVHPFLARYLPVFQQQYQQNYLASWGAFLKNFHTGKNTLSSRSEWLDVINNLSTGRNIFFRLLNDADFQLAPFNNIDVKPDWFEFVLYYQDMLAMGENESQSNPKKNKVLTKLGLKVVGAFGAVGKAIAGSAKSSLKTKKKLDKASGAGPGPSERELNLQEAAKTLDEYKGLISNLVFNVEQQKESHKTIKAFFEFENNPIDESTPLANAKLTITKLQGLIGKAGNSTEAFWSVYIGAILVLEDFMLEESACLLEQSWEDDFLYELSGVPKYKLDEFVYGEGGVLWAFFDSTLKPFVKNKRGAGYGFKKVAEKKMPFEPSLLDYLIRAKDLSMRKKYESFELLITAEPTDTSENSLLYVSKTDISLNCPAEDQTLVNNNFIVKKLFKWDDTCRSVSIKFKVGNKTLEKVYDGENAVLDFLLSFKTGKKRFDLEEFPEHFYELNSYKIQYFDVNLDIEGAGKLSRALSIKPPKPPTSIAQCWA
jgi:type VI secretion system protein ImpL